MDGKRLIERIRLTNLLSYGPAGEEIELQPLNVLIGPNASGKSNLIEALGLLKALPGRLAAAVLQGGGVAEWLWKGGAEGAGAAVETVVTYPESDTSLRHRLSFTADFARLQLLDEEVTPVSKKWDREKVYYHYETGAGLAQVNSVDQKRKDGRRTNFLRDPKEFSTTESVLSQLRDPVIYPELTYLARVLGQIRLFRGWHFNDRNPPRAPAATDQPDDFLLDDASNLALILNDLQNRPAVKKTVLDGLRKFYDRAEDITTKVQGGTVQIFLHERGLRRPIPAVRLSDGMLRYLCLLTILCHPEPPPLVCIEEPELGLHPDILPTVAELLVEASRRTQLFVTTHSTTLVSALDEVPEAVIVCEHDDEGTHLRRLEPERMKVWLEKYTLGELWSMGEIGGNPW